MSQRLENMLLAGYIGVFLALYFLPVDAWGISDGYWEGLRLAHWYAREHVLLCLVPAFFIAGAIAIFVSREAVIKYLGAGARQVTAYAVASVSGSVLAVCSCTVLPLFAGIYRMGAGVGPATAFLYAGPAINVMAIILTARVLGFEMGLARAVGAIVFAIVIGVMMQLLFRRSEVERVVPANSPPPDDARPLWKTAVLFGTMVSILVAANWGHGGESSGLWELIFNLKWHLVGVCGIILSFILVRWFAISWFGCVLAAGPVVALAMIWPDLPQLSFSAAAVGFSILLVRKPGETSEWWSQGWALAKQMLPLLLLGVVAAGLLLGRPGHEGLLPPDWISSAVGGNSIGSNLFASVAGAFMYFATLTEVPILQGLMDNGMGRGPALALLLAGPALSLPNMLVIRSVMGTKRTAVYVALVVVMATISGLIFGAIE